MKNGKNSFDKVKKITGILKEDFFLENNLQIKIVPKIYQIKSFYKKEIEEAIKWLFKIDTNDNI